MLQECGFQWVASCIRRGCCGLLYLIPSCGVAAQASQSEVPGLRHNLTLCMLAWQASPFAREEGSGVKPIRELYCCSQECSPIRLLHIVTNIMGLSQMHWLTNHVTTCASCAVIHVLIPHILSHNIITSWCGGSCLLPIWLLPNFKLYSIMNREGRVGLAGYTTRRIEQVAHTHRINEGLQLPWSRGGGGYGGEGGCEVSCPHSVRRGLSRTSRHSHSLSRLKLLLPLWGCPCHSLWQTRLQISQI